MVEPMLDPRPGIGTTHVGEAVVGIGVAFCRNGDHMVNRIRHEEGVFDFRHHEVIDVGDAGQFVTAGKPGTDQQFVALTQHMCHPHHPVHVDLR
jgi:hypothetical protein